MRYWTSLLAIAAPLAAQSVTYTRDVAPIFQAKCQQCHRPNDIAPFALDGYEAALDWKGDIKLAVSEGRMPPWKPVAGAGDFRGNFSLTQEEKDKILAWVDLDGPKGEDSDMPAPLPERGEWVLGEPDLVLQMPEPYTPPRGKDMYRCFVLPTGVEETKYVGAYDVLPGDRRSVHHVILFTDTTGEAEKLDAKDPEPGYTCFGGPGTPISATDLFGGNSLGLGGWAPGTRPSHLPDGVGVEMAPKTRVVMQIHYYARSGASPDQTRVGLYYAKSKVEKRLIYLPVLPLDARGNVSLTIPAGANRHVVNTEFLVPLLLGAQVVSVFPHMHLLGTDIKAEIVDTLGRNPRPLVHIDKWDFNWQGPYVFSEPVKLPALNRVRLSCTYDNSAANPRNPNNPLKTVRWGEGTEDEMCLVFLGVTFDRDRLQ